MNLKDKLKSASQKTVQAVALTAGITAGITASEVKAEQPSEKPVDTPPIVQVDANTLKKDTQVKFLSPVSKVQKGKWVKEDIVHKLKYLDLMTSDGKEAFTYTDIVKAEKTNSERTISQKVIDPNDTPYTEYEKDIIEETVDYISEGVQVEGGKDGVRNRIYQVLDVSGYPKISYTKDDNSFTADLLDHRRSNYSPGSRGHIYINEISDFIPEVAHAYRHQNNLMGERGNFITDGLKDILTLSSVGFSSSAQLKNYTKVGYMEHDTHSIVEPVLYEYISQTPMGSYGEVKTLPEVAATIDMLRHQQNDSSAIYTWTSEGDEAVAEGKEILRERFLLTMSSDKEYMAEMAKKEGITIDNSSNIDKEQVTGNTEQKKMSSTIAAAIKNRRSNG